MMEIKYEVSMVELFELMMEYGSSDLHLVAGTKPCLRINSEIERIEELPELKPGHLIHLLREVVTQEEFEHFEKTWELDFSYSIPGLARFRGNAMKQRGSIAMVFRAIPFVVPDFEQLGLLPQLRELCFLSRGLVLVTGPTGAGKSTTLASMIDIINRERKANIITIEDPIEFLHRHKLSTVRQRELGIDTHSFAEALRHVLRHDPDVILIGEMRDLESISIALTAAETGHLVFSTLHTQTAPLTISRIIDVFSAERREQIRQQLANCLRGIISQQLLKKKSGGRCVAIEFMINTPAIKSLIREGKEHQLYNAIQMGGALGMQTMDMALMKLYNQGEISKETVYEHCIDKTEIDRMMKYGNFVDPNPNSNDNKW
ncbi:MAG: type IV pilus twitching motility protein PilT [Clostridia bacterium]|jgi:twitching motility protein PilT